MTMCTSASSSYTASRCTTLSVPRSLRITAISRLMLSRCCCCLLAGALGMASFLAMVLHANSLPFFLLQTTCTLPKPPLPSALPASYCSHSVRGKPRSRSTSFSFCTSQMSMRGMGAGVLLSPQAVPGAPVQGERCRSRPRSARLSRPSAHAGALISDRGNGCCVPAPWFRDWHAPRLFCSISMRPRSPQAPTTPPKRRTPALRCAAPLRLGASQLSPPPPHHARRPAARETPAIESPSAPCRRALGRARQATGHTAARAVG